MNNILITKLRLIAATAENLAHNVETGKSWFSDVSNDLGTITRLANEARDHNRSNEGGDR